MFERIGRTRRSRLWLAGGVLGAVVIATAFATFVLAGERSSPAEAVPAEAATASATGTSTPKPTATPEASPTPIKHAGILDGMPMTDDEWDARKDTLPLAVMVDNTSSANPHAGLIDADLVYEAFVEGGITRLMAVFWRQDAARILPVRSARTPFVNWVAELGAMYGHAGGAITENEANAIGQIAELGIKDLNAFSPVSSNSYYRDSSRYGPYDLATSTSSLREAASQLGYAGSPTIASWPFRVPGTPLPPGKPAGGIAVDYSGRLYAWQYIQWKWDADAKRYLRFQFGGPEVDADTGKQLAFSTVIVMRVPSHVVDENGHVLLDQIGSGPATVFTGGQAYEGTWKKDSREARTQFLGASGEPIVFERGPIFIQAIGLESTFDFTAASGDLPELPKYEPPAPGPAPGDTPDDTAVPTATPVAKTTPTPSPSATKTSVATGTPPTATAVASVSPQASTTPASPSPTSAETPAPPASATPGGSVTVAN